MIRFLIKFWPVFLPLIFYIIWVKFFKKSKKKDYIEGSFQTIESGENKEVSAFSLENKSFLAVIFLTLILIIIGLIFIVVSTKPIKSLEGNLQQQKIIVE